MCTRNDSHHHVDIPLICKYVFARNYQYRNSKKEVNEEVEVDSLRFQDDYIARKYQTDFSVDYIATSATIDKLKKEVFTPLEHYKLYRNEIVAGSVNPHYHNPRQFLDRLQKLMDEYCGGLTVNYMTNEKLLNIGLKKLAIMEEDLEKIAAEDLHELLRAWELKHRHRTSECVMQHTLFRKETRWPGYYYRGDAMKLDDENWHVLTVSRRDPETGSYTMEKAPLYHLEDVKEVAAIDKETIAAE